MHAGDAVEIAAVVGEVLGDQVQLDDAPGLQRRGLGDERVRAERPVPTAPQRDGAEGAPVVAALADLQVCHVPQAADGQARARVLALAAIEQAAHHELRDQLGQVPESQEEVDLGDRPLQLVTVPLDHAADGDERAEPAGVFEACGIEQRVDGLFLGRVDERARVHDQHIGVGAVFGRHGALSRERGRDALGVDGVLIAPEREDGELHRVNTSTPGGGVKRKSSSGRSTPVSTFFSTIVRTVPFSSMTSNFRTR